MPRKGAAPAWARACVCAAVMTAVRGQVPPPDLSANPVTFSGKPPGITLSWSLPNVAIAFDRVAVTIRNEIFQPNFNSIVGRVDGQWFDSNPTGAPTISFSDRNGWMRVVLPDTDIFDVPANNRGKAPFYLRSYETVGSYQLEVRVDAGTPGFGSAPQWSAGLVVYEDAPVAWNAGMRILYSYYPQSNVIRVDFWNGPATLPSITPPLNTNKQVWLRIDYDAYAGTYTFYYRYFNTGWTLHGQILEQIIPYGGRVIKQHVGMFARTYTTPRQVAVDFAEFRFYSTGTYYNRPRRVYFPAVVGPTSGFVPLPRYQLFRISMVAIALDNSTSVPIDPIANVDLITSLGSVLGGPVAIKGPTPDYARIGASTTAPFDNNVNNPFRLRAWYDFSSEPLQRNLITASNLANPGTPAPQGGYQTRATVRPQIALATLYDKSSMYCGNQRWFDVPQGYEPTNFSPTTNPLAGTTIFVVVRPDTNSAGGYVFGKGSETPSLSTFALQIGANNQQMSWRAVGPINPTSNSGGATFPSGVSTAAPHLWTLQIVYAGVNSSTARPLYMMSGWRNGINATWRGGAFGTLANDRFTEDVWGNNGKSFKLCSDETGLQTFLGHIYEVVQYQTGLPDAERESVERQLMRKYYIMCPSVNASYIPDARIASSTAPCWTGRSEDTCRQTCPTGMRIVAGNTAANSDRVCRYGTWTTGNLACGYTCPALSRPTTASGCTRVLQLETWTDGRTVNDVDGMYTAYTARVSSTVSRWKLFPIGPDVGVYEILKLISFADAPTMIEPLADANIPWNVPYDPLAVWRLRDRAITFSLPLATGTGPTNSETGLVELNSLGLPNIAPWQSFFLVSPNPAWLTDNLNNPPTRTYQYSLRVRPLTDRSGMVFRYSTSAAWWAYNTAGSSSFYAVDIDIEASDAAVNRDNSWVVRLWRSVNGGTSTLAFRRYTELANLGLRIQRGRWYTIQAIVTSYSVEVFIHDDETGVGVLALVSSDLSVPPGSIGMLIDGRAQFDDVMVNSTCAEDGSCAGIMSNIHNGMGGACMHSCPLGYVSTGSFMRVCDGDGNWTGSPLSCMPRPPEWVLSTQPDDGGATLVDGVPYLTRAVDEKSAANVLVGAPLVALPPSGSANLVALYKIPTLLDGVADNGNIDPITGQPAFKIDVCSGQVRVANPVLNFHVKPVWNVTVWAYVVGETGSLGFAPAFLIVNLNNINDAPVLLDQTLYIPETAAQGALILPALVADDPDGDIPVYEIAGGNDAGFFALGNNPPIVIGVPAGQLSIGVGVNVGTGAGTPLCSCAPRFLDFETQSQYVLTVRARDGRDSTLFSTAFITIRLNDTNDAPVFQSNQVRLIEEANFATPNYNLGGPVAATDTDSFTPLNFTIVDIYGGVLARGDANGPRIAPASWPLAMTIDGQLSVRAPGTTFQSTDPTTALNGYTTRAAYMVVVQVTDNGGASTIGNVTVYVLANASISSLVGTVTGIVFPSGGLNTAGGDVVQLFGDYFDPQPDVPLRARYGPATWPLSRWYNASCFVEMPALGVKTVDMHANCTTMMGLGPNLIWRFFQDTYELTIQGSVRALTSYGLPFIDSVVASPLAAPANPSALLTAGNEILRLQGQNFGNDRTQVGVTFTGPSPFALATRLTYTISAANVIRVNHTFLDIRTPAGVGSGLVFTVTVATQVGTGGSAAYGDPVINSVSVAPASTFTTQTLPGLGNNILVFDGAFFGPQSVLGTGYNPTVTYGPTGRENLMTMLRCTRVSAGGVIITAAQVHSRMICYTARGMGQFLFLRVQLGLSGVVGPLSAVNISYAPPVIARVPDMTSMNTAGGERVSIYGSNFGDPVLYASGAYAGQLRLTYGYPLGRTYTTTACAVELIGAQVVLACTSPAGVGAGFYVQVSVGGQASQIFVPGPTEPRVGYGAPIIAFFDTTPSASSARSEGNEAVIINGLNFGSSLTFIVATYTLTLRDNVRGNPNITEVVYRPLMSACRILTPHTRLSCNTTQGAGAGLVWTITVDGQRSVNPTTAYEPPQVWDLIVQDPVSRNFKPTAATEGGDWLLVTGRGFGPAGTSAARGFRPVVQAVFLISPLGVEALMPESAWLHQNATLIRVTLPSGSGQGWRARVKVADRDSAGTSFFDYTSPVITSMVPSTASTRGGVLVTLTGLNFGLLDPLNELGVVFGNVRDGSVLSSIIRTNRLPRPENDTVSVTPYLLDQVTFVAPASFGAGRAVRLVTFRSTDALPNPLAIAAVPQTTACSTANSFAKAPSDACSSGVDVFTYDDPRIEIVAVTRPSSPEELAYASTKFVQAIIDAGLVRILTIFGRNLGTPNTGNPAFIQLGIEYKANPAAPTFSVSDLAFELSQWSDTQITVYTANIQGVVRTFVKSGDWSGQVLTQYSNEYQYDQEQAPKVTVDGVIPTLSSSGQVPVKLIVQNLGAAPYFNVTLGGVYAPILDPSSLPIADADIKRCVIDDSCGFNFRSPGPLSSDTTWTFIVLLPEGQGVNVPLVVNKGARRSVDPVLVDFIAPQISTITVSTSRPVAEPVNPATRYLAGTDGTTVITLTGTNLGVCPMITLASFKLCFCSRYCSGSNTRSLATDPNAQRSHTSIRFTVPVGEGTGGYDISSDSSFLLDDGLGWKLQVDAGYNDAGTINANTQQAPDVLLFGYEAPVVRAVASASSLGFPTRGNVRINVAGENFGAALPSFPNALLPAFLQFRVYVGSGAFVDPLAPTPTPTATPTPTLTPVPSPSADPSPLPSPGPSTNDTSNGTTPTPLPSPSATPVPSPSPSPTPLPTATPTPAYRRCNSVTRTQTQMTCTLPAGGGGNQQIVVLVHGQQTVSVPLFNYNLPLVNNATITVVRNVTLASNSTVLNATTTFTDGSTLPIAQGPAVGGFRVVLRGNDFGVATTDQSCIFVSARWLGPEQRRLCNGREDFAGEGEVPWAQIFSWTHERVEFRMLPGIGRPQLAVGAWGQVSLDLLRNGGSASRLFQYEAPVIERMVVSSGPTSGNSIVTLMGMNFGPSIMNLPNNTFPMALPAANESVSAPLRYLRVNWGPQLPPELPPRNINPTGVCVAPSMFVMDGVVPASLTGCKMVNDSVWWQNDGNLRVVSHPGVGVNISISVSVIDGDYVITSVALPLWKYDPPQITKFDPRQLRVGIDMSPQLRIEGRNFGTPAELDAFKDVPGYSIDKTITVAIDGSPDVCVGASREVLEEDDVRVRCSVDAGKTVVGYRNTTITIAGQSGFLSQNSSQALQIVCDAGFFGRPGEACLPCPPEGADCLGYVSSSNINSGTRELADIMVTSGGNRSTLLGFHNYPRPRVGFYNLNGSMASACPPKIQSDLAARDARYAGRDVCIVACEPPDSCIGNNYCSEAYASKAPLFRCASCAPRFYRRAGECVKCPDSPAAVVVVFVLIVLTGGFVGYILNRKKINVAYISMAVDYFQVLSIFGNARVKWPQALKDLWHILSAFNLNIEIVAPECLVPDVGFKDKFAAVMILPIGVATLFLIIHLCFLGYKRLILRRSRSMSDRHSPTLVSALLMLCYLLYLYVAKTTMDVYNCVETGSPQDGKRYLQATMEECYKPGGVQDTLAVWFVLSFICYIAGYPAFVGTLFYKNRELIMEDQLLRAKGTGDDRVSNPNAYAMRKAFGRLYYQFKPDCFYWVLVIVLRKFLIAVMSTYVNQNPALQLTCCVLVMFFAYAAQVYTLPYMGPAEFRNVLKSHEDAANSGDALHVRLQRAIRSVAEQGRKRVNANSMMKNGRIDSAAVLGVLTSWLFNYNTVEAILLICAVIVPLFGIMYAAIPTYDLASRDAVTGVIITVVSLSIIYWFTVTVTEIFILYNEAQLRARSAAAARRGKKLPSSRKAGSGADEFKTGPMETAMNPIFLSSGGSSDGQASSQLVDTVLSSKMPTPELWSLVQRDFVEMNNRVKMLHEQLATEKREAQTRTLDDDGDVEMTRMPSKGSKKKQQFGPATVGDDSTGRGSAGTEEEVSGSGSPRMRGAQGSPPSAAPNMGASSAALQRKNSVGRIAKGAVQISQRAPLMRSASARAADE